MSDTTTVTVTRNHNMRVRDTYKLELPADSPHLATLLAGADASRDAVRALDAYLETRDANYSETTDDADDPAASLWVDAINGDADAAQDLDFIVVEY